MYYSAPAKSLEKGMVTPQWEPHMLVACFAINNITEWNNMFLTRALTKQKGEKGVEKNSVYNTK